MGEVRVKFTSVDKSCNGAPETWRLEDFIIDTITLLYRMLMTEPCLNEWLLYIEDFHNILQQIHDKDCLHMHAGTKKTSAWVCTIINHA